MTHTSPDQGRTPFFSRPAVRRLLPFVLITAVALVFIFENTARRRSTRHARRGR
ncbi:hypothetical protein [Streptomyces sp. NRRL WC-3719]|uniref:hypothetical protein n=1 Tax=Streptomyces sp. NRRL WC-3719 TaxID=1463932 RepID=UPI000AF52C11|nr:hypothetical protein [Streptomyces sp. NRRL WC-3719]